MAHGVDIADLVQREGAAHIGPAFGSERRRKFGLANLADVHPARGILRLRQIAYHHLLFGLRVVEEHDLLAVRQGADAAQHAAVGGFHGLDRVAVLVLDHGAGRAVIVAIGCHVRAGAAQEHVIIAQHAVLAVLFHHDSVAGVFDHLGVIREELAQRNGAETRHRGGAEPADHFVAVVVVIVLGTVAVALVCGVAVLRARRSDLRAEILVGTADIGIGDLFLDHLRLAGLFKTERRCCSAKLLRQACGRISLLLIRDLFGLGLQARLLCVDSLGLLLGIGLFWVLCIGLGGRIFGHLLRLGLFQSVAQFVGPLGLGGRHVVICSLGLRSRRIVGPLLRLGIFSGITLLAVRVRLGGLCLGVRRGGGGVLRLCLFQRVAQFVSVFALDRLFRGLRRFSRSALRLIRLSLRRRCLEGCVLRACLCGRLLPLGLGRLGLVGRRFRVLRDRNIGSGVALRAQFLRVLLLRPGRLRLFGCPVLTASGHQGRGVGQFRDARAVHALRGLTGLAQGLQARQLGGHLIAAQAIRFEPHIQ